MKEADKRLLEFGKQTKSFFESKGYGCSVMRPWNNEYEISLKKAGDFYLVQAEIKNILTQLGFEHIERPSYWEETSYNNFHSIYVNLKESIGCNVDEERHYIAMYSEFSGFDEKNRKKHKEGANNL